MTDQPLPEIRPEVALRSRYTRAGSPVFLKGTLVGRRSFTTAPAIRFGATGAHPSMEFISLMALAVANLLENSRRVLAVALRFPFPEDDSQ